MLRAMEPAIAIQSLTKRYGEERGIEDLTLSVERGEVFGFLGPNGAGKTTTIGAVLAEHRSRGDTVFLSSHDLDEVQRACDRVAIIREGRLVGVEAVAAMRARAYRHVTIEFADPVDPADLEAIPGVAEMRADGRRVTFQAHGSLDAVVKAAARHAVADLEVTAPTLEEIFLTYYAASEAS
jgi:ABC-2 type transport system ATP-binding protein